MKAQKTAHCLVEQTEMNWAELKDEMMDASQVERMVWKMDVPQVEWTVSKKVGRKGG